MSSCKNKSSISLRRLLYFYDWVVANLVCLFQSIFSFWWWHNMKRLSTFGVDWKSYQCSTHTLRNNYCHKVRKIYWVKDAFKKFLCYRYPLSFVSFQRKLPNSLICWWLYFLNTSHISVYIYIVMQLYWSYCYDEVYSMGVKASEVTGNSDVCSG